MTEWLRAARRPSYTVRAKRWEHGWELHIAGVGVTQSHGLDDAEMMVRDYIALDLDVPADSFDVVITPESAEGLTAPLSYDLASLESAAGWRVVFAQALRDAVRFRHGRARHGDQGQIGLYRAAGRQFGIDIPDEVPPAPRPLDDAQREVLGQGLGDAVAYWQREAGGKCDDCENSAAALCDDHAAALDRIDVYKTLARELGIEVQW